MTTLMADVVESAWQELCERDDRTSPEDYPDMCLITQQELAEFMSRARLSQAGAGGGVVEWRLVPVEPDELQIEAMRDAFRQARRGGVGGMTIDAQWRRENAPELAAYSAALTAAPTPPATPVQPTASVEAVVDQASRLMAAGWRGNPNMSGDDRDFMTPSMRRRHDDKVRQVVELVIASLTPAPTQGGGAPLTPKQRVMVELDRRLAAKSAPSPAPVSAPATDGEVALPETTDLPPMTDRGVEGQIMDEAWPHYGGSNQPADFWHDFGEGVRFAAHFLKANPAPGHVEAVDKNAYDNMIAWMSMNAPYRHMMTFKSVLASYPAPAENPAKREYGDV